MLPKPAGFMTYTPAAINSKTCTLHWSTEQSGGPSEVHGGCIDDMGLSAADVQDLAESWQITLHAAFEKIVDMGGYAWQMLQVGGKYELLFCKH